MGRISETLFNIIVPNRRIRDVRVYSETIKQERRSTEEVGIGGFPNSKTMNIVT